LGARACKSFFYLVINVRGRAGSDSSSRMHRSCSCCCFWWYICAHAHTHRPQTDEAHARCFRQHYYIITRGWEGGREFLFFFFSITSGRRRLARAFLISARQQRAAAEEISKNERWYTFKKRLARRTMPTSFLRRTHTRLAAAESFSLFVGKSYSRAKNKKNSFSACANRYHLPRCSAIGRVSAGDGQFAESWFFAVLYTGLLSTCSSVKFGHFFISKDGHEILICWKFVHYAYRTLNVCRLWKWQTSYFYKNCLYLRINCFRLTPLSNFNTVFLFFSKHTLWKKIVLLLKNYVIPCCHSEQVNINF